MKNPNLLPRRKILAASAGAVATAALPFLAPESASAQGRPIKIGFSVAQSGALGVAGKSALVARLLWRDDVNARGGIMGRPVELVYYDDQTNPSIAPSIYAKLIDLDKVDVLWGPYGTLMVLSIMPMIKQRERLLVGLFSTGANDTLKNDKYFHVAPFGITAELEFPAGFTKLAARKGIKNIALLTLDTEGTQIWAETNRKVAKRLGLNIVYDQKYPLSTVDFSSIIRSINATNPEAVYVASFPNDSVGIIRAIEEIGLSPGVKLFGGGLVGLQNAALLEKLGPQLNGIVNYATYVPEKSMNTPGIEDFFKRYAAKAKEAGADPLGYYAAQYAYVQGQVTEQAINATKSLDSKVLAAYLHEAELNTIVGNFRFGPTGEFTTMNVVQVQFTGIKGNDLEQFRRAGTQPVVEPAEKATTEVRMPFAAARKGAGS